MIKHAVFRHVARRATWGPAEQRGVTYAKITTMKAIHLIVAVVVDAAERVLCVAPGEGAHHAVVGEWALPAIALGEAPTSPEAALLPFIKVRFGVSVVPTGEVLLCGEATGAPEVRLQAIFCRPQSEALPETPTLRWVAPDLLETLSLPPAEQALIPLLKARFFARCCTAQRFGRPATFLATCASTNDEALRQAESNAPEGTLVVSDLQTAGRGRLGREWLSEPGQGLLFSLLARPNLPPEHAVTLPLVAGLAVTQVLRHLSYAEAGLKWPNDVLLNERKVCGVLCEAQTSAHGMEGIIIGVGLNIGAVPAAVAHRAAGLCESTSQRLDRLVLLAAICSHFEALYVRWLAGGLAALKADLAAADCKCGKTITVKPGAEALTGISRGIREDGALLLETAAGLTPIHCGEIVQWAD